MRLVEFNYRMALHKKAVAFRKIECPTQLETLWITYGSEGWGFESLRAR